MFALQKLDQPEPVHMLGTVVSTRSARFGSRYRPLLDVVPDGSKTDSSLVAVLEDQSTPARETVASHDMTAKLLTVIILLPWPAGLNCLV